jgi:hypothetical protein
MIEFLRRLRSTASSYRFWYVLELAAVVVFNCRFRIKNQRKLSKSHLGQSLTKKRKRVLIPLVETSHAKIVQMLLIGVALKLRGHKVFVLVCNGTLPICELRSSSNKSPFPCARCKLNLTPIVKIFRLELIQLSEMSIGTSELVTADDVLASIVKESVVRHFYGNLNVSKRELSRVEELHSLAAAKVLRAAEAIEAKYDPDIVIGYMLVYTAWEPLINYFKERQARVVSITSHFFDKHAQIIDGFELYDSRNRFDRFRLIAKEANEPDVLDGFLRSRWGDYASTVLHESFSAIGNQRCSVRRSVLFCPNIHWDYGMDRLSKLFDSIEDWVYGIVPLALKFPDIEFVVRAHPGESSFTANGSLGVCDLIRNHANALPKNLKLLGPESPVKSYDLLAEVDVVVVMNGTIGLEALLAQKQVIVTGSSPYAFLEGVFSPSGLIEYEDAISGKVEISSPNYCELREFAYFYFLKTAVPWDLTPFSLGGSIYDSLSFDELSELELGANSHIDHICECIIDQEKLPESW